MKIRKGTKMIILLVIVSITALFITLLVNTNSKEQKKVALREFSSFSLDMSISRLSDLIGEPDSCAGSGISSCVYILDNDSRVVVYFSNNSNLEKAFYIEKNGRKTDLLEELRSLNIQ